MLTCPLGSNSVYPSVHLPLFTLYKGILTLRLLLLFVDTVLDLSPH